MASCPILDVAGTFAMFHCGQAERFFQPCDPHSSATAIPPLKGPVWDAANELRLGLGQHEAENKRQQYSEMSRGGREDGGVGRNTGSCRELRQRQIKLVASSGGARTTSSLNSGKYGKRPRPIPDVALQPARGAWRSGLRLGKRHWEVSRTGRGRDETRRCVGGQGRVQAANYKELMGIRGSPCQKGPGSGEIASQSRPVTLLQNPFSPKS